MTATGDARKPGRTLLLALVWVAALGSLAVGLKEGLHSGLDFQWSGARLLAKGTDPWKTYLLGDPNHEIILGHQPNYLPELYVLLLPLGRMSFPSAVVVWCGLNLLFTAASLVLVAKFYRLSRYNAWMLAGILLLSTEFRVSLANGQQSLFALFFFALALSIGEGTRRGISLGLAFAKYSFAPVLVILEALRLRWRTLAGIAIPIALGIAIVSDMTRSSLSAILLEPLRVPRIADSTGAGDIMTMSELLLPKFGLSADTVFSLGGVIGLTCAFGTALFLFRKRFETEVEVALIATLTLFCLKHLGYDYVFLVFPAALLLRWNQPGHAASGRAIPQAKVLGWIALLWLLVGATVRREFRADYLYIALFSDAIGLILLAASIARLAEADAGLPASGQLAEQP